VTAAESTGSWADGLAWRVEQARVPEAAVYGSASLVVLLALEGIQWLSGAVPVGTIHPLHVSFAALIGGLPWLIAIFNRSAIRAVRSAAPLVTGGSGRAQELEAAIARAPRWLSIVPALVFLPIGLARIASSPSFVADLGFTAQTPWAYVELLAFPVLAFIVSAYAVKIASLAFAVHRITTRELAVDIWDVSPLLAFSTLTARMSASTVLGLTTIAVGSPRVYADAVGLAGLTSALTLAFVVFLLPLRGLHERLVEAKQVAETTSARQMQAAIDDLRASLAAGDLSRMDPLNKAMGALEIAQRSIARVPVWPWSTETFRWVVGALMFPITLFVAQLVLARLLEK